MSNWCRNLVGVTVPDNVDGASQLATFTERLTASTTLDANGMPQFRLLQTFVPMPTTYEGAINEHKQRHPAADPFSSQEWRIANWGAIHEDWEGEITGNLSRELRLRFATFERPPLGGLAAINLQFPAFLIRGEWSDENFTYGHYTIRGGVIEEDIEFGGGYPDWPPLEWES